MDTAINRVGEGSVPAAVHWPEVFMEALGLGLFVISAGLFGTLVDWASPSSPVT